MRLALALAALATGPLGACQPPATIVQSDCGPSPPPSEPPHSALHLATDLDTAYARHGLARFVFRVRSAGPTHQGIRVNTPRIVLQDTLSTHLPPLGSFGDSTGVAVVDSVRVGYTSARVQGLGYITYTVPLVVRPGYSDTIGVALAEARLCLAH